MPAAGESEVRPAPPYRIETERLVLRPLEPSDAPGMFATIEASGGHLSPWMGWAREPAGLEATVAGMRRMRGQFDLDRNWRYGLFDPASGAVLGLVSAGEGRWSHVAEVGYWLAEVATGRGLAQEAVGALVRVLVELLGFERVVIRSDPANEASLRLARRLGFREEGTLRLDSFAADGSLADSVVLSLLAAELAESPAAAVAMRARDGLGRELGA